MRTTLELPDDLMKRAKIAAVRRGSTLTALLARAIARELAEPEEEGPDERRARFPIFHPADGDDRLLTPDHVARDEMEEDLRLSGRRP